MKKIFLILTILPLLAACCNCEKEPIIEQNHKLLVPPDFGKMPSDNK